ncbi:hypothetical protein [Sphaerisporangium sp. NPDC051011]|uniref:hypothetical protein n=1 Tax=Sphaerisporangium sp. NPDC051011 TaxID=3155792 RepID=UPI00340528F3
MSRTAHHVRSRRAQDGDEGRARGWTPWRAVTVTGLRYAQAEVAGASKEGRRPRPRLVRRRVEFYSFPGAHGRGSVTQDATIEERRERSRLRDRLSAVTKRVGALRLSEVDDQDDLDVHPYRPRHGVLWLY